MRRITPSFVVAIVALVLASAGGATAATKLITGKQIKNSSITSADVKNESLTGTDLAFETIGPSRLSIAVRDMIDEPGPVGPAGPVGPPGPPGPNVVNQVTRVEASASVAPGDVDSVRVDCPAGQGVVSGGFQSISAEGEVFFADTFGSPSSWAVGLDNFDSSLNGDVTAVAFCAPSGQAAAPRALAPGSFSDRVDALVRARRASHR